MAKKPQPATTSSTTDDGVKTSLKRFTDSWNYQRDNWHKKWNRDNKLYAGERYEQAYEGLADTFVPMTFPMVETMVSALANGTLRFDFTTGDPMKDPDTRALNGLIDEWWESDQWDLKNEESIREMLITGMAGGMLSWDIDRPRWYVYSMRDMIVDPTVSNPADLQEPGAYAGRRYLIRKGSLDDFKTVDIDPKSATYGELINRYNIPSDTGTNPVGDKPTDRAYVEMFTGSTLANAAADQDEIIELWDIDHVETILNRAHTIESVVNPYKQRSEDLLTQKYTEQYIQKLQDQQINYPSTVAIAEKEARAQAKAEAKGIVPFWFYRNYRRASQLYAKSEIDSIAKHQELLNDLTNLETDMLIKQNAPQRELDPQYEDWIDLINSDPDTVYPFKPGSLQYVQQPILTPNLFNNRLNIKNEMREATAIDQVAKGVANIRDTTATEVKAQLGQTGQRIESKARTLEKDAFFWMATILFRMVQLYVTQPMLVKVSGPSTKGNETGQYKGKVLPQGTAIFDPTDYDSQFTPKVSLEVDSKAKKDMDRKQASSDFQMLIQDPSNNLQAIKKIFYPRLFDLDKQDLDSIMTQATPTPAAGMSTAGGPAMTAPTPMTGAMNQGGAING
jgi:hypothetical protein